MAKGFTIVTADSDFLDLSKPAVLRQKSSDWRLQLQDIGG
jgi:hypothetical protein